jgi:hypothetical protein
MPDRSRYGAALDDYFHVIVRTRPWTKKEDEALLEPFGNWLETQSVEYLDEFTSELIRTYIEDALHGHVEREAFGAALHRLLTWAEWQGLASPMMLDPLRST